MGPQRGRQLEGPWGTHLPATLAGPLAVPQADGVMTVQQPAVTAEERERLLRAEVGCSTCMERESLRPRSVPLPLLAAAPCVSQANHAQGPPPDSPSPQPACRMHVDRCPPGSTAPQLGRLRAVEAQLLDREGVSCSATPFCSPAWARARVLGGAAQAQGGQVTPPVCTGLVLEYRWGTALAGHPKALPIAAGNGTVLMIILIRAGMGIYPAPLATPLCCP